MRERPEHPELFADLTAAQREAVLCTDGPLLVLAGPGSGKTRVITRRIAHLLALGVRPWQILAVTFTNKAAGEMRHRVGALVGGGDGGGDDRGPRGLTVTTFHSLCVRLLRRYTELWLLEAKEARAASRGSESGLRRPPAALPPALKPDFTVFDADDQASMMKKVLVAMDLSTTNWPPRSVLGAISKAKNDLVDADAFGRAAGDFQTRTIARVYERYDAALRAAGGCDFDDLLMLTARMLRESAAVRDEVQRRYRYLLIDEYQDTNKAQFVIANLIAGEDPRAGPRGAEAGAIASPASPPGAAGTGAPRVPNICVVGDPDQSIYGWRGADIGNILRFEENYPSAKVIPLGENFRSLAPIINAADRLIRRNARRKHKTLVAMRSQGATAGKAAAPVDIVMCRDEHHEAALALDWIRARRAAGEAKWGEAAVMYRTNALSRVMEDALRNAGVPYTLVRGTAFYQREEVKTAVAYLRVLANPADSVSLARMINTPSRGISDATLEKIEHEATRRGMTAMDLMREIGTGRGGALLPGVTTRALNAVGKFVTMVDGWLGTPGALKDPQAAGAATDKIPEPDEEPEEDAGMFAGIEFPPRDEPSEPESQADGREADGGAGQGDADSAVETAVGDYAIGGLADLVGRVVRESGLEQMYKSEEERVENLAELVSSARDFEESLLNETPDAEAEPTAAPDGAAQDRAESIAHPPNPPRTLHEVLLAYLERVSLVADTDALGQKGGEGTSEGTVTLMTLHAAKGLEYKAVVLLGLEESILPHTRSAMSEDEEEEERRLCFVGITRAMDHLMLTSAKYRTIRGQTERMIPSRFIDELRGDAVRITDLAGDAWGVGGGGLDDDDDGTFGQRESSGWGGGRSGGAGRSSGNTGGALGGDTGGGTERRYVPDHAESGGGGGGGSGQFPIGSKVRHPQFGVGVVEAATTGNDARVRVKFRDVGIKTLVVAYARLQRA